MRCYLNIGNTHTQILTVGDDGARSLRTVPTAGFDPARLDCEPGDVAAACVVTEAMAAMEHAGIRMAIEFPRETGLILRCAGKAGNPFQTTQGNRLSCRIGYCVCAQLLSHV